MNANAKVRVTGNETVVGYNHRVLPGHAIEVTTLDAMNDAKLHESPVSKRTLPKTIGMVFAAPFIGLAYAMALPVVGIYLLAKLALEAYANRTPATSAKLKKALAMAKNIGLFFAAPFVALAYIIALPMVGIFMIARLAIEAHRKHAHAPS